MTNLTIAILLAGFLIATARYWIPGAYMIALLVIGVVAFVVGMFCFSLAMLFDWCEQKKILENQEAGCHHEQ